MTATVFNPAESTVAQIVRCFPNQEYYQEAVLKAEIALQASAESTEKAIEAAQAVQYAKRQFGRKGYAAFLKSQVKWSISLGQKYVNLANTFEGVDLYRLRGVEVGTLFKLCGKKYRPVVARIKSEVGEITQRLVEELIKKLLPKKPRKQKQANAYGNAVLQKHSNAEDGTFYFTLKQANLSESIGSWLESELESKTLGQVLQAAMHKQQDLESFDSMREQMEAQAEEQARKRAEMRS